MTLSTTQTLYSISVLSSVRFTTYSVELKNIYIFTFNENLAVSSVDITIFTWVCT